jgi:hypothetical protein
MVQRSACRHENGETGEGDRLQGCGTKSDRFHFICPECGRPLVRDSIDTRIYPRDPDLQGTFGFKKFWARIILVIVLLFLGIMYLIRYGIL